MITFSLRTTPQSTIGLAGLWDVALPEVIAQLSACGYTVDHQTADLPAAHPALRTYPIEPGPATLTALSTNGETGSLRFVLTGPTLGMRFGTEHPTRLCGCGW